MNRRHSLLVVLFIFGLIFSSFNVTASNSKSISVASNTEVVYNKQNKGDDYRESIREIVEMEDGNYIVLGSGYDPSTSTGQRFIVKVDCNGTELWKHVFVNYTFVKILMAEDNCCYFLRSKEGKNKEGYIKEIFSICKMNLNGSIKEEGDAILWEKELGEYYHIYSIVGYQKDSVAIIGINSSIEVDPITCSLLVTWFDSDGNEVRNSTYKRGGFSTGEVGTSTSSGGLIILGRSGTMALKDAVPWVINIDKDGSEIWNKTYNETMPENDWFDIYSILEINDEYLFAIKNGYHNDEEYAGIIKINKNGKIIWNNTYYYYSNEAHTTWITSMSLSLDNNIILLGVTVVDGLTDVYLLKIDFDGKKEWELVFGNKTNRDEGISLQNLDNSQYLIFAQLNNRIQIIRSSSDPTFDSDEDSLPDWWELEYFGNLESNGTKDSDNDGHSNYEEYVADTDPTDPLSSTSGFYGFSFLLIGIVLGVIILLVFVIIIMSITILKKKKKRKGD